MLGNYLSPREASPSTKSSSVTANSRCGPRSASDLYVAPWVLRACVLERSKEEAQQGASREQFSAPPDRKAYIGTGETPALRRNGSAFREEPVIRASELKALPSLLKAEVPPVPAGS